MKIASDKKHPEPIKTHLHPSTKSRRKKFNKFSILIGRPKNSFKLVNFIMS